MKMLARIAVVACFALVIPSANAEFIISNTSDNVFDLGVRNQGWWSTPSSTPGGAETFDANDNYFVGSNGTMDHRDFFSFYLDATDFEG